VMTGMKVRILAIYCCFSLSAIVLGQESVREEGIRLDNFDVYPELQLLGAHDKVEGAYGETQVRVSVDNAEARYDVGWAASYGYRVYDEYPDLDEDFYGASGKIRSDKSPLKMGVSAQYKKTVDYDVRVSDGTGSELGSILTSDSSTRSSVRFDAGYEKPVTGNGALRPSYEGWYYNQSFADDPDAEWQEHTAGLEYGYNLESSVVMSLSGTYGVQMSDIEDGSVVSVEVGLKSWNQEKISWKIRAGLSSTDYDSSGTDQGFKGSANVRWQVTEKISTYVFGDIRYEPAYAGPGAGGARHVFRAGYGGQWAILDHLRFDGQVLHDRQKYIQTDRADDRHFANVQLMYDFARRITVFMGGSYIYEDLEPERVVVSCGITAGY